ncbi:YkvA family protein [Sphingomicrobium clamense]|uniref:DUF1232 domain-containing protein n=1 Tax=Sphingomicrobium clamense TaxID=2851013 RepID=A0ABS6V809_9SPHN|nr:DUF1232 domain-containing protein [Sphingomicrobium sp. B8]MBW0145725.1 DUF1232 domain-containing protein [Sphingomicrobium sp. B8]
MKRWAARLKRDALTVWIAARDRRVKLAPKLVAAMAAAYAFSPLDLIPDFIPVLGLVDDLIIVPLGLWVTLKMIPDDLVADLREKAAALAAKPVSRTGLAMVLAVWAAIAVWAWSEVSPA